VRLLPPNRPEHNAGARCAGVFQLRGSATWSRVHAVKQIDEDPAG
jgi:hypothetical protein